MKHLGLKGRQWLKGFHMLFAGMWVGAGVCLVLMQFFLTAESDQMLHGIDISMKFIDDFIIIPGAIGTLITGILFALLTNWGFFKHNWIIVKWIINIGGIIFGTFFLGVWINGMPPLSGELGLAALADPTYMHNKTMNTWLGPIQVGTLIAAIYISTLKPWKRKKGD